MPEATFNHDYLMPNNKRRDPQVGRFPHFSGGYTEWFGQFFRWLFAQNAITVILIGQSAFAIYLVHYSMTKAIPDHLEAIQKGYYEVTERNAQSLRDQTREHTREVAQLVASLEAARAQDRQIFMEILREVRTASTKIEQKLDEKGVP